MLKNETLMKCILIVHYSLPMDITALQFKQLPVQCLVFQKVGFPELLPQAFPSAGCISVATKTFSTNTGR